MTDQLDHAPIHTYLEDGSTIYEPESSNQETSFSSDLPQFFDQNNQGVELVEDIDDSQDFFELKRKRIAVESEEEVEVEKKVKVSHIVI